nr:MAG TPA: hypothetical protein [Caudoviricetes sp.]
MCLQGNKSHYCDHRRSSNSGGRNWNCSCQSRGKF